MSRLIGHEVWPAFREPTIREQVEVFLGLAAYLLIGKLWWGYYTLPLIKGCAAPFLVLAGLITLAIAKE